MEDTQAVEIGTRDLSSLFGSAERNFLVRNNGDQVKMEITEMTEYEDEAYSFAKERAAEFEEQKRKQRLRCILVSGSCNFVISAGGKKLPVSEVGGRVLGLYFAASSYTPSIDFTSKLLEIYEELKNSGESFEIVMIPLDDHEEAFKEFFETMPWFALPVKDKRCQKLAQYFKLSTIPTLAIIGSDGAILRYNVAKEIKKHGSLAYPFTAEKLAEVAAMEHARKEAQTIESCLIMEDRDFVIGKDDTKILVSKLLGKKNILLYFSAHCPCHGFTPKLIEAYNKIKAKDTSFEIIFVSSDKDQASFDEHFTKMPWLALPFGDKRKAYLSRNFSIRPRSIPKLIAIGSNGQTVSEEVIDLILVRGSDAYPFTEERLREIDEQMEEMAEDWPEKVKYKLHDEHELVLTRCGKSMDYGCERCFEGGSTFSYRCVECDIDLHPKCALREEEEEDMGKNGDGDEEDEWVCGGEVCYRP